jgi:putative ABC transport system ATP-binding protein
MSTSQSAGHPDPTPPLATHALVRIAELHKAYRDGGQTRVLFRGLDLVVQRGERIAIVGRSGTGKSTLLNLISGIDLPDTGSIEIDGQSIQRMSERERTLFRRRHIGFVFQFFNLVPTLTVRENVQLPLELQGLAGHHARTGAEKWLERVELAHRADSFPEILSGGEQQRVAVARALASDPLLLLADEPTGNLDREAGKQVLDLLVLLSRAQTRTVILVTHSLEVAARADRVLRLDPEHLEWIRA